MMMGIGWLGLVSELESPATLLLSYGGLREGLKLCCCTLNILCLEIEMDAKSIVDVLWNADYVNEIISPILDDCRQLLTRFHQVRIKHCFWQGNQCANGLARMSFMIVRLWTS